MKVSIIIPAYNEAERLPKTLTCLRQLCDSQQAFIDVAEVVVVDDGSEDQTLKLLNEWKKSWPLVRIESFPQNRGKGAAIHMGMQVATSELLLIADADMATPWEEYIKLRQYIDDVDLVMGSRSIEGSQVEVRQHWIRQSMGRIFNKIIRSILGLPFLDTQCGFKLLKNHSFFRQEILPQLQVQRFAWDVELVVRILEKNGHIKEVPIRWLNHPSSRVHIFRDSLEMLITVLRLKKNIRPSIK